MISFVAACSIGCRCAVCGGRGRSAPAACSEMRLYSASSPPGHDCPGVACAGARTREQQIGPRQSGSSRLGPLWTDLMQRVEGSIEPQGMRGCEHAAYGVAKRQRRRVELREEAAHRPPVAREAVALAADLLGRHELGRAAQRERPLHAHLQTVGGA